MLGLEFTGQAPFHTIYLHGLVRDGDGRKMSKTLGNVIDPREVMDDFGTDALRFTLLTTGTPGNDLNLSLQRVESNRNFANKIWNIARFVISNVTGEYTPFTGDRTGLDLPERWILARLNQTVADVTRLIDAYEFGQAGTLANEFLWGDFADWYIEAAKVILTGGEAAAQARTRGVLVHVLDQALRLLHPYVPYVTEAVWRYLPHAVGAEPALIVAAWPVARAVDQAALDQFGHLQELVRGIRNARAENKVEQARRIPATIVAGEHAGWLGAQRPLLLALARLDDAHARIVATVPEKPRQAIALVLGGTEVYLPMDGLVDLAGERERLTREAADFARQIQKSEALLGSDFAAKAPVQIGRASCRERV